MLFRSSSLYDFDGREHTNQTAENFRSCKSYMSEFCTKSSSFNLEMYRDKSVEELNSKQSLSCPVLPPRTLKSNWEGGSKGTDLVAMADQGTIKETVQCHFSAQHEDSTTESLFPFSAHNPLTASSEYWQPPLNLSGLSIEEVSKCLRFIGLPDDIVSRSEEHTSELQSR